MGDVKDTMLRPLSIGEIFDRAITLLVRNWLPFLIIAAVGVLPSQSVSYFADVRHDAALTLLKTATYLFGAVAALASARVVAAIYRNEPAVWYEALGAAFGRLPSAIGANVTMALIAILPLLIVVGIPAGLGVFRFPNLFADLVAVIAALAGLAIFLGAYFANEYVYSAMMIDDYRAMDGVGRALELFGRDRIGRTLLFALAAGCIMFGGSFVAGALLGLFETALHNRPIGMVLETLLLLFASAVGQVAIPIFYFDTAIRREGYDMQLALDSMPGAHA
jgi:hypothetical protein